MSIRRLLPFFFTTVADPREAGAQLYIIVFQPPWSSYDRIGRSSDAARFAAVAAGRLAFTLRRVAGPGALRRDRLFRSHPLPWLVQGLPVARCGRESRHRGLREARRRLPCRPVVQERLRSPGHRTQERRRMGLGGRSDHGGPPRDQHLLPAIQRLHGEAARLHQQVIRGQSPNSVFTYVKATSGPDPAFRHPGVASIHRPDLRLLPPRRQALEVGFRRCIALARRGAPKVDRALLVLRQALSVPEDDAERGLAAGVLLPGGGARPFRRVGVAQLDAFAEVVHLRDVALRERVAEPGSAAIPAERL